MSEEVLKPSRNALNNLAIILRTSQIHDSDNVAVINQMERFISLVNTILEKEKIMQIDIIGEFFYINDSRVKYTVEYLLNFDFLMRELKKRDVGTIIFKNKLNIDDIKLFTRSFISAGFSQEPFDVFLNMISGLKNIVIARLKRVQEDESTDMRKIVKKTYFNAVSFSKGVMNRIRSNEAVNVKKAKRIVESMVDLILEDEHLLIGMTSIKDYDEYTYHHSVNVSVLSIAIGQRIGLNRRALNELGLAALFHDTGKVYVPHEILNKPTSFTDEEWNIMKRHPEWGVKSVLRLKSFDPFLVRSAIVAFEHHLNYDYTGYPKVKNTGLQDLYSRIVTIADQYDAMTSSRVYSRIPLPPDKALSILIDRSGTQIDPLLLKFFINIVGVFPLGSLVFLDTGELGIVYQSNPIFVDRPRVRVLIDSTGTKRDYIVDLSEKDSSGKFIRSIVKTLDYNKYKINLAEYFM